MKLLRSFPRAIPPGRNYVVDGTPKLLMEQLDYRPPLEAMPPDDILILEWDIAVAKDDLVTFARRAARSPEQILVAPYKLYKGTKYSGLKADMWVHRRWDGVCDPPYSAFPDHEHWRPVEEGEPTCNLFGFGMTYFPRHIIECFLAVGANCMSDTPFGVWHYQNVAEEVPIAWDCPAVHLNYEIEAGLAPFSS